MKIKVGMLVMKRWGRIEPEEQGRLGLVVEVVPGNAWTYISVSYPFGVRTYRTSELEIMSDVRGAG